MSTIALSEAQLRAQVKSVFDKVPEARVMGIHAPGPWSGAGAIRIGSEEVEVAFCPSALALRERLASREVTGPRLVLVTDRTEAELGIDVLARLAKRRLYRIEPWRAVLDQFRARSLDPRLPRDRILAEALLDWVPPEGYPPVPSGVLDEDTVWDVVARRVGLDDARPDARDLLHWTLVPERLAEFDGLPAALQSALVERLAASAGQVAAAILRCVGAGCGGDAVPIGLVCRVLFTPAAESEPAAREARVRLEPAVGGEPPRPAVALVWADVAEAVIGQVSTTEGSRAAARWLDRAEAILREVRGEELAHLSTVLASGFEQRLGRLASVLTDVLAGAAKPQALAPAEERVLAHAQAAQRPDRAETVRMACRLTRWLRRSVGEPASLAEAAVRYADDGGFADWARVRVWDGDPNSSLADVCRALSERVAQAREQENRHFAELLAGWTALGSSGDAVVPVEQVLEGVIAPLAEQTPVLLLVVDGMSLPVFHELIVDVTAQGWVELAAGDPPARRPAIAALPTVTETSRTSLLCGALCRGTAPVERNGFASHPALVAVSRAGLPPVLFHKPDLVEPGGVGLPAAVAGEIARAARQVVGVVINAVDDHLAKGDQLRVRWTVDAIRPLSWLLDAARDAGRAIVLTSDHGHVLHRDTVYRPHETDNLRCRPDDGAPAPDEIVLRGPRVLSRWGNRVIAPWSERLRYGIKQNGYHGGATPEEVVVPLAVLVAGDRQISGSSELPPGLPEWWEVPEPEALRDRAPSPAPPRPTPRAVSADRQPDLFTHAERARTKEDADTPDRVPWPSAPPGPSAAPDVILPAASSWIDCLFASPIYVSQKTLAARPAVEDERVRVCLQALEARGGKLTRAALARALGLPPLRVTGLIAALRRLLNVDGYPVLALDEASDTVELNRALLATQFELDL